MIYSVRRSRGAFTLIEMLVVMAIIAVLAGLLLPAIQKARESANKTKCTNQMKQLALAFQMHESQLGVFPSHDRKGQASGTAKGGGTSGTGFAIWSLILDYIEQGANTGQQAAAAPVPAFLCPSRRGTEAGAHCDYAIGMNPSMKATNSTTASLSFSGLFTACHGYDGTNTLPPVNNALLTINDGTSNTLFFAHKAINPRKRMNAPSVDAWTDGYFTEMTAYLNSGRGWANDGSTSYQFYSDYLIRDGSPGNSDTVNSLQIGRTFSTPHTVMPAAFADGSVRDINPAATDDLCVRFWAYNDGKTISGTEMP